MTKIKSMEVEDAGDSKIVKITLEKGGKEYEFSARATDIMDEKRFKSLLKFWNEKAIVEREEMEGITEKNLTDRIKEKVGQIISPPEKD